MRNRKVKEAGLVLLGLGLIGLFMLVADATTQKYHEYSERAEDQRIKRLMLYKNLLKRDGGFDLEDIPDRGNTFTMDEEW